jgi:hypothetical protein
MFRYQITISDGRMVYKTTCRGILIQIIDVLKQTGLDVIDIRPIR